MELWSNFDVARLPRGHARAAARVDGEESDLGKRSRSRGKRDQTGSETRVPELFAEASTDVSRMI